MALHEYHLHGNHSAQLSPRQTSTLKCHLIINLVYELAFPTDKSKFSLLFISGIGNDHIHKL